MIVADAVLLSQDFGLDHGCEQFPVQEFVTEPAVERLAVRVLPRTPRLDIQRLHSRYSQPFLHRIRDELGPVVRAQELRLTMHLEQVGQLLNYILGGDAPLCQNRVRFARVLVENRQHLESTAVLRLIHDKIVAPYVILVLGSQALRTVLAAPQTPPLTLNLRYAQSFLSPQTLNPFTVYTPALPPQQCPGVPIPATRMLLCHFMQAIDQVSITVWISRLEPLTRPRLLQNSARPTLGHLQHLLHMAHSSASPGRA